MVATSVFRRAENGAWRMVIDNSHGPAVLSGTDA
jgi:ketosteroid isomerase-like protein